MAKSKKRLESRKLRTQGESIKEIAKILSVSPGSVSVWCRDIQLSQEQVFNLQQRMHDPYYGRRHNYLNEKKEKLNNKIETLKQVGIKEIGRLTKREIFLIGVALYWGEGFKKDHQVGFATSDINMGRFFIFWLKKCFHIEKKDLILRITANISYLKKIQDLEKYWAVKLKINQKSFSKPFFQNSKWKKKYENRDDYHGVIRIKVRRSVDLLRKIYGFIEGVARI